MSSVQPADEQGGGGAREAGGPSSKSREDPRGRWTQEHSGGWWRHSSFDKVLSSVEFKLTQARDEELQEVWHIRAYRPSGEYDVPAALRQILSNATHFQATSVYSFQMERSSISLSEGSLNLAEALKSFHNPSLKHLGINGFVKLDFGLALSSPRPGKVIGLESLGLDGVKLDDEGLRSLAAALTGGNLPNLSSLSLRCNVFGSKGVKSLGEALQCMGGNLLHVDLSENRIGSGHLSLARAMECSRSPMTLEKLALHHTGIGNAGAEAYEKAMRSENVGELEEIGFASNGIGNKGAEALGRALQCGKLTKLKMLNLRGNEIEDDGIGALASALQDGQCRSLTELDLGSNTFTDKGIKYMSVALKSGHLNSLKVLRLISSRPTSEEGAKAMLMAFYGNSSLATVDVQLSSWEMFPTLEHQKRQILARNFKHEQIMRELGGSMVPATCGKVYLCGNPEVGKTTLRKSLQRSKLESLRKRERRQHVEKRTRGIEVSQLTSRGRRKKRTRVIDVSQLTSKGRSQKSEVSLMLWDMAGQNEFHVVHNAFFPDLAIGEGKASTFIVVCTSTSEKDAGQELDYWLRFIASSCNKDIQSPRNVFVVFNRFHGDAVILENAKRWIHMVDEQRKRFQGYLEIRAQPFIVDVRTRSAVADLKRCLIEQSEAMLRNEMIPEICEFLRSTLPVWSANRKHFPVLSWFDFVACDLLRWPEKTIEAAVKYLNEAGVLIYIDKEFPAEWGIPHRRLVVLDPNWFCREIVGNMFLPQHMVPPGEFSFQAKVNRRTGSISIIDFQQFFANLVGEWWKRSEIDDLLAILLWLGLCYKGREENLFIPALIEEDGTRGDSWGSSNLFEDRDGQWVMGYTVEHTKSELALAPILLWHRFQVELAQTLKYNGQVGDNDFVVGKYFITFKVDYMAVLIEVNADEERPTFDCIDVFVKPLRPKDPLDSNMRKQYQVDLASSLVHTLLKLWVHVCPGIGFVQRVVWPWLASRPRTKILSIVPDRNVEVAEVKRWVQQHGVGREMQWLVGFDTITEDQLLSTKDKEYVVKSMMSKIRAGRQGLREAVELKIFPTHELHREGCNGGLTCTSITDEKGLDEASPSASQEAQSTVSQPLTQDDRFLRKLDKKLDNVLVLGEKTLKVAEMTLKECVKVNTDLRDVMTTQKTLLRKIQDVGRMFLEDKERSCPKFIYLGTKDSGLWLTLKEAFSPSAKVHVHFACEAKYNDYGQHAVKDQPGIFIPQLKDWARKIAPWLKVSLTILFISAKIAANVVAPGMGLIIPEFLQWQQASTLAEGIQLATGYSKEELDRLTNDGIEVSKIASLESSQELYGSSRTVMTQLLGNLTAQQYEQKLGLKKVHLSHHDGSSHGVVWICSECFEKYRSESLVHEL